MGLSKRYVCTVDDGVFADCYDEDSFWYTDKGIIVKWIILASFIVIFFGWFVGGRIHAKRRLRKGLPLLGYHRFLISYQERRRFGQVPQNHFTFYQTGNPYAPPGAPNPQYVQRQDGAWAEPPPLYQNNDAPPQYFAPPGATKANPNQGIQTQTMELSQYGAPQQGGAQQSGVVGGNAEQAITQTQDLPPRPAKAKIMGVLDRFRR